MTATQTTTITVTTVTRGQGRKVHQARVLTDRDGNDYYAGTVCAQDTLFGGQQDLVTRPVNHPVTCKTCLGDVAAPAEFDAEVEVPACCPMHPQTTHITVKTIKAGTKSEYPCGAIFWHGKGWDPRRSHA